MPWNEPGSSGGQDPWGRGDRKRGHQNSELDEIINNVRKRLGGGKPRSAGGFSPLIFVLLALGFWAYNSVYTVDEGFESIELRFGKYSNTVGAGLQFIFWPIEQKIIINSQNVRTVEIGFRKNTDARQGPVPVEAQMLTTDENIADVSLAVQYNISNVEDLFFNVGNVERRDVLDSVVRGATESALREVVGSTTMDDLFNKGRSVVATKTKELLQKILDRYQTGVHVIAIEMQAAVPPGEVIEAFDNVNKADQLEQQLIKEAKAYEAKVVLAAEGKAARLVATAEGYKNAVIAQAAGESDRFLKVLAEYSKAPAVTRKRLYLETMEQVLGNANKVMIDQKSGNNMIYLPLDQIIKQQKQRGSSDARISNSIPTPTSSSKNQSGNTRGGR